MATPFLGELKLVSFNYAPKGWAQCNGQLLPIQQNQALFSLLGTTYGGNGINNFQLPNLRGRTAAHAGQDLALGQAGGTDQVTLSTNQLPTHSHTLASTSDLANASAPGLALPAAKPRGGINHYAPPGANTLMDAGTVGTTGGNQPHENQQPYTVLNWVIALQGIFPSRD